MPARESSQPSASRGVSESTRADLPIAECWFDGEGNSSESESAVKRDGYSWTRQVGRGAASFAIPEGVSLVRPACNSPHRPGADRVPSCQKNAARRRAGHFLRATSGSKAKTVSEFQLPFRIRRAARLVGSASGESVRALTLLRRSVSSLASTGMVSATNAASHERDRQLMARHGRG